MGEMQQVSEHIGANTSFPVLAIWGTSDSTCNFTASTELQSFIPRVKVLALEHVKHMLVVEYPTQIANALHAFFKEGQASPKILKNIGEGLPGYVKLT